MAHLEPTVALVQCERALRELLSTRMTAVFGVDWLQQIAPDKIVGWKKRRASEQTKRATRGVAVTSLELVGFLDFPHLVALAEEHWDLMAPALGDEVTLSLLHRFDNLRNTIAHSRELLPFEEDLVAGIAGEIRNRVTIFMSDQDTSGDYYPRIESITDSFGFAVDPQEALTQAYAGPVVTNQTLRVGDIIHFDCRATDPQGRELSWKLLAKPGFTVAEAVGNDVRLQWAVWDGDVSEAVYVTISVETDSIYHRFAGKYDGAALFRYRVVPPAG